MDIKGDNDSLRLETSNLGQKIKGKFDNMVTEMQNIADRVEETESRVEQLEGWVASATEALCTCLGEQ